MNNDARIIVALDYPSVDSARALVERLDPSLCRLKVATTLFTRYGPAIIEEFTKKGFEIFLDLKFHDIPQQVAGAVSAVLDLGVWMLTLHTQGGRRMMEAASEVVHKSNGPVPKLVGVTILTSLDDTDLAEIGMPHSASTMVPKLAKLAQESGLDGIVCSAKEASLLRQQYGDSFLLVTPGIRLSEDASDDQPRVMTPDAAIAAGVNYLVIGRSITRALEPIETLRKIITMIETVE